MKPYYESNGVTIFLGDCREVMPTLEQVHSIICDPPYELGFMGKKWDNTGIAYDVSMWEKALGVLRPGGHLLSFGGSRTYHRIACAIEDAGFEIRDQIMWLYGSGFPKSLDVSKAIDKAARGVPQGGSDPTSENHGQFKGGCSEDNPEGRGFGAGPGQFMRKGMGKQNPDWNGTAQGRKENSFKSEYLVTPPTTDAAKEWEGYGTALKPAHEPVCVARKPIEGTVAANVQKWGTGALNIDGCRIDYESEYDQKHQEDICRGQANATNGKMFGGAGKSIASTEEPTGRWPANVIHDGSDEVVSLFPQTSSAAVTNEIGGYDGESVTGFIRGRSDSSNQRADSGSAARFFYTAKASREERHRNVDGYTPQTQHGATLRNIENAALKGNNHPTVKPLELMAYLCKLLCPPSGGILLDPFMGSGSTIIAGRRFYQHCIGIELEEKYAEIAAKRLSQEVFDFGGVE